MFVINERFITEKLFIELCFIRLKFSQNLKIF